MKVEERPAEQFVTLDEDEVREYNTISNKLGLLQSNINDFNQQAQRNTLSIKSASEMLKSILDTKGEIDVFFKKLVEDKDDNLNAR